MGGKGRAIQVEKKEDSISGRGNNIYTYRLSVKTHNEFIKLVAEMGKQEGSDWEVPKKKIDISELFIYYFDESSSLPNWWKVLEFLKCKIVLYDAYFWKKLSSN